MSIPNSGLSLHSLMEKVERIQYQAALAVPGAWKGSNRIKLYEDIGWESLSDRRTSRRILQIHKIVTGKSPFYLSEKMPPNRRNLIALPHVFQDIRCRTELYLSSFYPNATSTWNNIISSFEQLPSFGSLKTYLLSLFRPNGKSTYGIYDPVYLRYILQLRVGLSQLRCHKKRHHFTDTPSDQCLCEQGTEDCSLFFLECPFYIMPREKLVEIVNRVLDRNNLIPSNLVSLFLYGHSRLNDEDNKLILSATIDFIKSTNRFSTSM